MIDLYTWRTPDAHKVHIMLEETGLDYTIIPVDISRGQQYTPKFARISPNNQVPAMVDLDGPGGDLYAVFEPGAILLYLSEKTGMLLPTKTRERYRVIQWLMFQNSSVGPVLGQAFHFRESAPKRITYAIDRYTRAAGRLYFVLDRQLNREQHVSGEYSIADIALYPWVRRYQRHGQKLEDYPNLERWVDVMANRPAVQRGLSLLADEVGGGTIDEGDRNMLFSTPQLQVR